MYTGNAHGLLLWVDLALPAVATDNHSGGSVQKGVQKGIKHYHPSGVCVFVQCVIFTARRRVPFCD